MQGLLFWFVQLDETYILQDWSRKCNSSNKFALVWGYGKMSKTIFLKRLYTQYRLRVKIRSFVLYPKIQKCSIWLVFLFSWGNFIFTKPFFFYMGSQICIQERKKYFWHIREVAYLKSVNNLPQYLLKRYVNMQSLLINDATERIKLRPLPGFELWLTSAIHMGNVM